MKNQNLYYFEDISVTSDESSVFSQNINKNERFNYSPVFKKYIRYEKISSEDLNYNDSFEKENLNDNLILEIPQEMNESEVWFQDRFIISSESDLSSNFKTFKSFKPGGNHPLAIKLRNQIKKLNQSNTFLSLSLNQKDEMARIISKRKNDKWYIAYLNVGHGDCTVIVSPTKKTYVFDFGINGEKIVEKINALWDKLDKLTPNQQLQKREVSGLYISHPDFDHYGGFIKFYKNINKTNDCFLFYNNISLFGGKKWLKTLKFIESEIKNKNLRLKSLPTLKEKNSLSNLIPGLKTHLLWPYSNVLKTLGVSTLSKNDSSICLSIGKKTIQNVNIFGDIEEKGWKQIINRYKFRYMPEQIFKYSHHGRNSGNFELFRPFTINDMLKNGTSFAIASTGYNFGHRFLCPTVEPQDMTNLKNLGIVFEIDFATGKARSV